jgi:hypothetical protein
MVAFDFQRSSYQISFDQLTQQVSDRNVTFLNSGGVEATVIATSRSLPVLLHPCRLEQRFSFV